MKVVIQLRRMLFTLQLVMAGFLLSTSCNKQQQGDSQIASPDSSLSESAKSYLAVLAVKKDDLAAPVSGKKKLPSKTIKVQQVNRFSQISKTTEWKNAFEIQEKGITYLFVPVKEDIKPFTNKDFEFFRYLIFSRAGASAVSLSVIEVLGDKKYSFESDNRQIAITAFKNKTEGNTGNIGNTNAAVIFYNNDYKPTASFKLNNGAWSTARITFRSDLGIR